MVLLACHGHGEMFAGVSAQFSEGRFWGDTFKRGRGLRKLRVCHSGSIRVNIDLLLAVLPTRSSTSYS